MDATRVVRWAMLAGMGAASIGCAEKNPTPIVSQEAMSARPVPRTSRGSSTRRPRARPGIAIAFTALENELASLRSELAQRPEPAAAPAPGWNTVPGGAMTSIEGTILFDSGKATLKTSARGTLESVVRVITAKYPDYDVYVFGHTDDTPIRKSGWKDNYELSAQRALSVVRMLRELGVENKLAAAGWGEQLPVQTGHTANARQRNRRVEIYAMAPESHRSGSIEASPPSGAGRGEPEPALARPQPVHRQAPPRATPPDPSKRIP